MAVKCGIVGLPNVGKSTLFNALTKAGIAAENFPFCTIEPNSGVVSIPDERLDRLADLGEHIQPRIGNADATDIRLDRAERIIRGLCRGSRGQRVEQGRFADIG